VTFNVTVLPAVEEVLTISGGVTEELVSEAYYQARPVAATVAAGTVWSNAGLFIDVNRDQLRRQPRALEPTAELG
jgi:hypothetical protein